MAYSELVKNFKRVRSYMRDFYVYGFKNREQFNQRSARSYDDERRRIESWLGKYMQFRQNSKGKNLFISIDSRTIRQNPLYKGWKTKSFTDGDITLHFIIFDILFSSEIRMSLSEITAEVDNILSNFSEPRYFDESTIRKKLKEYISEGLIETEKQGRILYYRRAKDIKYCGTDCLSFFSEVAPCGVVGSYLLDKSEKYGKHFAFKHHYITNTLDSEILYLLFDAMHKKCNVELEVIAHRSNRIINEKVVPLSIFISVQNGRQYLMAYVLDRRRINSYRLDSIISIKFEEVCQQFDYFREKLEGMKSHIWGVSTNSTSGKRMEHVEFTVTYGNDEKYIHNRMQREKRCGHVEKIDDNTSRFSADVFDAWELIPWIRTFICRITDFSFSDKALEEQFKNDLEEMYRLYDLKG